MRPGWGHWVRHALLQMAAECADLSVTCAAPDKREYYSKNILESTAKIAWQLAAPRDSMNWLVICLHW